MRERVIALAAHISALRAEIASKTKDLQSAESELDRMLIPTPVAGDSFVAQPAFSADGGVPLSAARLQSTHPAQRPLTTLIAEDQSMNRQIIALIDSLGPNEDIDADELMKGLPDGTNITSVRSALARLADQKKIRRATRGRYGTATLTPTNSEVAS